MSNKSRSSHQSDSSLSSLKTKIMEIRLSIKAHQEKNTNAHKAMKKQIAQLLTSSSSSRPPASAMLEALRAGTRGSIQIDSDRVGNDNI